jgi:hypothetical protein
VYMCICVYVYKTALFGQTVGVQIKRFGKGGSIHVELVTHAAAAVSSYDDAGVGQQTAAAQDAREQ